jgi:predicted metal-dependent hydrolase
MDVDGRLRAALVSAARSFNSGGYFDAHEQLEEMLDDVPAELWDLFVGLIQIAVGYHKVTQRLWRGAAGMLERGLDKVGPLPDRTAGLALARLRERVHADIDALRTRSFDPEAFQRHPPRLQLTVRQTR